MKRTRKEILPGVMLTSLQTDKFKTGCMSVTLLTQLNRENAAKNALIPKVLRRGTRQYPDMESLSAALDEMYGARIEPLVRKKGEIQCVGFYAGFIDDSMAPGGEPVLERVTALLGELLLSPNTRGGLLLPQYVDSEREKHIERIRAAVNDKTSYAVQRMRELMCFGEDFAVSVNGTEQEAEAIGYQKLTKYYRQLLAESPVEVFYCGRADARDVEKTVADALAALPRGEINWEIGTDVRMNAMEEQPRRFFESLDVTQGKLAVGFRLGDCMEEPDYALMRVFNAVYGGGVTSKLFANVRERLSLCYFASSGIDRHKGVMTVVSGIEFEKYEAALSEILAQLQAIGDGQVTPQELTFAKRYVATDIRASLDSPAELEDFWLSQNIEGLEYGPEELAVLCEDVTVEEVVELARGIECDAIYFLQGPEQEEQE